MFVFFFIFFSSPPHFPFSLSPFYFDLSSFRFFIFLLLYGLGFHNNDCFFLHCSIVNRTMKQLITIYFSLSHLLLISSLFCYLAPFNLITKHLQPEKRYHVVPLLVYKALIFPPDPRAMNRNFYSRPYVFLCIKKIIRSYETLLAFLFAIKEQILWLSHKQTREGMNFCRT